MITIKYKEQHGDYVFTFDSENMGTKEYSYFQCRCGEIGKVRNDNIKDSYVCKHPRKYLKMQFGKWTVIDIGKRKDGCSLLVCQCSCDKGTIRSIPMSQLLHGKTLSCGCEHYRNMMKRNEYIQGDKTCEIVVGDNRALIDREDFDTVKNYCWCVNGTGYVIAWSPDKHRMISLARTVMSVDDSNIIIDHINGNTLDNRRCNLRMVNSQKNSMNQGLSKNNTSGHKGVHWHKNMNKWIANIGFNGKLIHIGYYENFDDAVLARDKKEKELYGQYSREIMHVSINHNQHIEK